MSTAPRKKSYDESNIKNLGFPESIRQKPTLYIGPIDERGVLTILREVADNIVDEALAGRASTCDIFMVKSEASKIRGFYVLDDGEGIPVKPMKIKNPVDNTTVSIPAIKAILSMTHTSGKFNDDSYAASRGCFTGDTEIRLLNGKVATMASLYERWVNDQTPIPLMSFNLKKQQLEPSNISHVQITKRTRDLVKVRIDDGSVVKCTPDHPFYVNRGGSIRKVQAQHLIQGDSLVSTYYEVHTEGRYSGYPVQTEQGVRRAVHRVVADHMNGGIEKYHHVHHKNRKPTDNRPSNLEVLTKADHAREHSEERSVVAYKKIMETQGFFRQANSEWITGQNVDEDFKAVAGTSKATRIAARALLAKGKLTEATYNAVRSHTDMGLVKAIRYHGTFDALRDAAIAQAAYLKSRVKHSMRAEDEIAKAKAPVVHDPVANSQHANWMKTIQFWSEFLLGLESPRDATPAEFNQRKGAGIFGRYANLRQFTTLKWLKAHVLDGEELRLYEDLSSEAKRQRLLAAEVRMRVPMAIRKMITAMASGLKKIQGEYTEEAYMAVKASCAPVWDFGLALIEHTYGQVDLAEFVRTRNHSVVGVQRIHLNQAVPVYDLTVDKTHTFFIEPGLLVKNSHGLGVKASNALSRVYDVFTFRDGSWWEIGFRKGVLKTELMKVKSVKHPVTGKPLTKGTLVYMEPDPEIFQVMQERTLEKIFSAQSPTLVSLLEWCRLASYFTTGLTLRVHHYTGNTKEFYSENGPQEFIKRKLSLLNKAAEKEGATVELIREDAQFTYHDSLVECVVAFTNADGSNLDAFTNGLRNVEGGVHVDAFLGSLKTSLSEYAPKKSSFTIRELRDGLVALVNVKLSAPQFDSQTKEKLVDERAGKPAQDFLTTALSAFFKKHKALAVAICERANNIHALKSKFTASKKVINALRTVAKKGLPVKASVAPHCKSSERELFIIEGDSAAGSCRAARDAYYQESLPIKGKIKNVLKDNKGKALESQEIINILAQIGYDPKAENPYDKLRVSKIVCLADPDPDGPLIGHTTVHVRYEKEWRLVTMYHLSTEEWSNRDYEVLAWNGHSYCIAKAFDCRVTKTVNRIVKIKLSSGHRLECDENHNFPIISERYDDRINQPVEYGLKYVRASDLKTGDRIVSVDEGGMKHAPHNVTGIQTLNSVMVEKIKISLCPLTQVYCLTVPTYHNFVLGCGVVSKNCHINSLLLTLFYKFLPELFNRGMVYVAEVPEFYAIDKNEKLYSAGKAETLASILAKAGVKADICHIKGYGEISSEVLRTLAFDPRSRVLSRIIPTESESGEVEFTKLMGNDSESRKKLLGV